MWLRVRFTVLTLGVACAAAEAAAEPATLPWEAARRLKTRTEVGLQHPDVHLHGFVLSDVFLLHTDVTARDAIHTLIRRQLSFDTNTHLLESRRLTSWDFDALDASATRTAEKVRAIAQLAYARSRLYTSDFHYSSTALAEPAAAGELLFGSTYNSSYTETIRLWHAAHAELDAVAGTTNRNYDTPVAEAEDTIGIAALLFKRGTDVILFFRDTAVSGDYSNIQAWITRSIIDSNAKLGMTQSMKRAWTDTAGLEWGTAQQERESESDRFARVVLRVGIYVTEAMSNFVETLVSAVNGQRVGGDGAVVSLTKEQATKYGYWPVTMAVVDQVRANVTQSGGRLLLAGHSQGGGRAQLARMYTQKMYNERWPVITVGAVGPFCFSRNLDTDGRTNYLEWVDPDDTFENVWDYTHVFDPWGHHLGPDIGKVCNIGLVNMQQTSAYKYCSRVWGYSGARIVYESQTAKTGELSKNFDVCKYFTHGQEALVVELNRTGALLANGETSHGCIDVAKSKGDCPSFDSTDSLIALIVSLIAVGCCIVITVALLLAFNVGPFNINCFLHLEKKCTCCPCNHCRRHSSRVHTGNLEAGPGAK